VLGLILDFPIYHTLVLGGKHKYRFPGKYPPAKSHCLVYLPNITRRFGSFPGGSGAAREVDKEEGIKYSMAIFVVMRIFHQTTGDGLSHEWK
jgi:hypothetical protein